MAREIRTLFDYLRRSWAASQPLRKDGEWVTTEKVNWLA
jgi:hypothetical protein